VTPILSLILGKEKNSEVKKGRKNKKHLGQRSIWPFTPQKAKKKPIASWQEGNTMGI